MKMNQEQAKQWGDHTYPPIQYGNAFNDPRPGAFIPHFTLVDEAREEQRQAEAKAAQAREEVRKAQQAEEKLYGDLFTVIRIDNGFRVINSGIGNPAHHLYSCKSCGTVVNDRRKHYEVRHPAQNNQMIAEARRAEVNVEAPVTAPSSTETAQKFNRALLDDPEFQADLRAFFTSITYFSSQRSKGLFFAEFVDKWLARIIDQDRDKESAS